MCKELDGKTDNDFEVRTILPNDSEVGTTVIIEDDGKFHKASIEKIERSIGEFVSGYDAKCKLDCSDKLVLTATKYDLK